MKITILNENTVFQKNYKGEHGLSLLIENDGKQIIFDVGQTDLFLQNAKVGDIDLSHPDAVVLSHGHYDHTGGLAFYQNEKNVPVYLQKKALCKKVGYQKDTESYYFNGIPWLDQKPQGLHLLEEEFTEIFPGVFLISKIPYVTEFEKPNLKFFLETEDGYLPDDMSDEQILVIEQEDRIHMFAGCSHPGIINCIYEVTRRFPGKKFGCIAAGMHLVDAGEIRCEKTLEALDDVDFDLLLPMHCTGMHSIVQLKERFKERCKIVSTGDIVEI